MIKAFEVADGIVQTINEFQASVGKRKIKPTRRYHFVDGTKVPENILDVSVYPMARRKERLGNVTKKIIATFYVVLKSKVLPNETIEIDKLIEYGAALDEHFEGRRICGATNVVSEDEQFWWFPDELHQRHHFSSLLELQYYWQEKVGGISPNP